MKKQKTKWTFDVAKNLGTQKINDNKRIKTIVGIRMADGKVVDEGPQLIWITQRKVGKKFETHKSEAKPLSMVLDSIGKLSDKDLEKYV